MTGVSHSIIGAQKLEFGKNFTNKLFISVRKWSFLLDFGAKIDSQSLATNFTSL